MVFVVSRDLQRRIPFECKASNPVHLPRITYAIKLSAGVCRIMEVCIYVCRYIQLFNELVNHYGGMYICIICMYVYITV